MNQKVAQEILKTKIDVIQNNKIKNINKIIPIINKETTKEKTQLKRKKEIIRKKEIVKESL